MAKWPATEISKFHPLGGILRSDEYVNLPGCLDGVDIPRDQLSTVIHEVLHMMFSLPLYRGVQGRGHHLGSHPAANAEAQVREHGSLSNR